MAKDNNKRGGYDCCSFCGRSAAEVGMLFSGMNGATICDECVERGYDVLQEQNASKKKKTAKGGAPIRREDVPKPAVI